MVLFQKQTFSLPVLQADMAELNLRVGTEGQPKVSILKQRAPIIVQYRDQKWFSMH